MLKPSIFISYKVDEERTAEVLALLEPTLVRKGFDVWRDVGIEPGAIWSQELYTWLMECSGAIVLLSEEAAKSEWCRREWWFLRERHRRKELQVIPVTVDGSLDSAGILDEIQALSGRLNRRGRLKAARPSIRQAIGKELSGCPPCLAGVAIHSRTTLEPRAILARCRLR
jgi:TIR domain